VTRSVVAACLRISEARWAEEAHFEAMFLDLLEVRNDFTGHPLHLRVIVREARQVENDIVDALSNQRLDMLNQLGRSADFNAFGKLL
jgi:hypothetical protein